MFDTELQLATHSRPRLSQVSNNLIPFDEFDTLQYGSSEFNTTLNKNDKNNIQITHSIATLLHLDDRAEVMMWIECMA